MSDRPLSRSRTRRSWRLCRRSSWRKAWKPALSSAGNAPAFRLGDLSTVRMAFGVPDTLVSGLKLGAMLAVHVDALPDRSFQGRVREIAAAADPSTRLYRVEVAIPNKAQQLKAGMMGKVSVAGNQPAGPAARGSGELRCCVHLRIPMPPLSSSSRADPKDCWHGCEPSGSVDFVGSRITVLAGLKAGERVVTGGKQNLVDGALIRVVE